MDPPQRPGSQSRSSRPRLESLNDLFGWPSQPPGLKAVPPIPIFTGYAAPNISTPTKAADSLYYTNSGSTVADPGSVTELGRTYHGYKDGKYLLPNDAVEQDRLDLTHFAWLHWLNGALYLAPIADDQVRNVLDIGTGTGIWALEFVEHHPDANVIGTDLSQIQPWGRHPNVQWVQEDAEDDWLFFPQHFDFIHLRGMFTCFDDPKTVMRKTYEHLRPGGWVEYQDGSANLFCQDTSSLGTAIHRWAFMVKDGAKRLGRDLDVASKYKGWLEEIGFVDVRETVIQVPANTWPEDPKLKSSGSWSLAAQLQGYEAFSLRIMHHGLGMALKDIEPLVAQIKQDVYNKRHRFSWTYRVVYGRKPPS